MCGRYSFAPTPKQQADQLDGLQVPTDLQSSYNIAPTQRAYVIANDDPERLQPMAWGLVPFWSKDGVNTGKLFNARSEGIAEKPAFRTAVRSRRCLVPADSFYEWRTGPDKRKIPYRILAENGELLFLAGIWEEWGRGEDRKRTFSIITTTPNAEISALHDRMPVVLPTKAEQDAWLADDRLDQILPLLHPPEDGFFKMYRVSEAMNRSGIDGPDIHDPVPEGPRLF